MEEQMMKREIARIMSGNRFSDCHPTFTVACMLTIVIVVIVAALASLLIGLAGVLSLLEIQSVFDRFFSTWHWWELMLAAVVSWGAARVLMAYGAILHKRWV